MNGLRPNTPARSARMKSVKAHTFVEVRRYTFITKDLSLYILDKQSEQRGEFVKCFPSY